ncbi:MAG: hypothetical protein HZA24_10675 [Nitrospirae bacterium]|nr:hypothetical protein [Nitrospirota bacterium]
MANPTDDMAHAAGAVAHALTDSMVERLATTLGNVMEVADRLNDPDTKAAVDCLLDNLTTLHQSGGMQPLFDLLHMLGAAQNAATDSMIERGAALVEHLVSNLANEDVADLAHQTQQAMREARQEQSAAPSQGGLLATLALLGKPETQSAIRFLVSVTGKLRRPG